MWIKNREKWHRVKTGSLPIIFDTYCGLKIGLPLLTRSDEDRPTKLIEEITYCKSCRKSEK
jgi:hypothetical protein